MKSATIETILKLFDVSREEAERYASEFLDLVESKGGNLNSHAVIESLIPKVFGDRLKWRNNQVKQEQEEKIKSTEKAYNNYLNGKNKGKW